jgi:chorismate--pyruvate lyase
MLQRSLHPATRRRARRSPWPRHDVSPALRRWLTAPGSLTARLRALGQVEVVVQYQGSRRLSPAERRAIGQTAGHVREVILTLDGQAVVWARSVTSHRALRGPWRALKGLGSRPLAELLFSHARVQRGPLLPHEWRAGSPEHGRACRQWHGMASLQGNHPPPRRGRASVFWHHSSPLRVMEAFSPWARQLATP